MSPFARIGFWHLSVTESENCFCWKFSLKKGIIIRLEEMARVIKVGLLDKFVGNFGSFSGGDARQSEKKTFQKVNLDVSFGKDSKPDSEIVRHEVLATVLC